MSKVSQILDEAKARLLTVTTPPYSLTGRVIAVYDGEDLLEKITGAKDFPIVGIVYEGKRATATSMPTNNFGLAGEATISFVLIEQDDKPMFSQEKKARALGYLEAMSDEFLGTRSTVTRQPWEFVVEAIMPLSKTMVAWRQIWNVKLTQTPKASRGLTS